MTRKKLKPASTVSLTASWNKETRGQRPLRNHSGMIVLPTRSSTNPCTPSKRAMTESMIWRSQTSRSRTLFSTLIFTLKPTSTPASLLTSTCPYKETSSQMWRSCKQSLTGKMHEATENSWRHFSRQTGTGCLKIRFSWSSPKETKAATSLSSADTSLQDRRQTCTADIQSQCCPELWRCKPERSSSSRTSWSLTP